MRLATSRRNRIRSLSTILNGAPSTSHSQKSRRVRSGPSSCCCRAQPVGVGRSRTTLASAPRSPGRHRPVRRFRHPGTDPHPGRLTPRGVIGRQPGMTFLGGVQRRDLPGEVVIPDPAVSLCMLIVTPTRRGYMPPGRSGRLELLPAVHWVCRVWDLGFGGGTKSWTHVEGDDRWRCSRVRSPVTTADHRAD